MKEKQPKYYLDPDGAFVIENYNFAKPFASFFPGIAGKYGIPMWAFYTNRGQGIASFGTKDKDHAILEFFPANKAWQLTSTYGFRTFIKIGAGSIYEPFHNGPVNLDYRLANKMSITSHGLKLKEDNLSLGLEVEVEYFTVPQDSYAALARILTVKNRSRAAKKIQLLDGLPQIVPFGTSNFFLKKLGRTIEAWMNVENLRNNAPFYKLDVDPSDKPEVIHIKEGNFYLAFHYQKDTPLVIRPIIDPGDIFGPVTDFSYPAAFASVKKFIPAEQRATKSKMPCGFASLGLTLAAGQAKTLYSVIGHMRGIDILNSSIHKIIAPGYIRQKKEENKKIIEGLQQDIATNSSSREFDLYAKQTYLDNVMRGGYPVIFKSASSESVFYLYSRKHGDLERDYNKFQLQPSYFSQGNGNYRDTNQNRRMDVWFNPQIQDANVISFFNLIQADGFNPLVVKGTSFQLKDTAGLEAILQGLTQEKSTADIITLASKPFSPGDVILFIEENKIRLKCAYDEFLKILLGYCDKIQDAEHGEGFWTDHWTYNLDLLESYLGVYPEKLKELFFEKRAFTFYDNIESVKPRSEKYLLKDGRPRQLYSLYADNLKREMIKKRPEQAHAARTEYGKGQIYRTNLINKLACLLANKLASLDPNGCGIEMEADKPNWYDALNGLPALFGSSLCETFELKRLILFIKGAFGSCSPEKIYITGEIHEFLTGLDKLLKDWLSGESAQRDYLYWDKASALKEAYRHKTKLGFSGSELEMDTAGLLALLENALKKIDAGIDKARDKKNNTYSSYFINEASEYETIKEPFIRPLKFKQIKLPLFLEGQMHALRLSENSVQAAALHKATRLSPLYDKKLRMYKVTAGLSPMPEEIGRCRVFSPGWLENESIWLHMEYKYLLELLRRGLEDEFYADFRNVLIPFQNPKRYGRSILENSSFLVSSAFSDKSLHGNGFVARLSGSTAEFLQIWLVMNLGKEPFYLNRNNELNLKIRPLLAGWLFDSKGAYCFNFLSKICVVYYNPKKKNTFGKNPAAATRIVFNDKDGKLVEIHSDIIPAPYAQQTRSCLVKRIDVYFE